MPQNSIDYNTDILIVSAMPEEQNKVLKIFKNSPKCIVKGLNAQVGLFNDISICSSLVGIGKVNAAMNTQKLIDLIKPKLLIFSGVAGGVIDELRIGDVLVAKAIFQHDYGFSGEQGLIVHRPGFLPEVGVGSIEDDDYIQKLDQSDFFESLEFAVEKSRGNLNQITTNVGIHSPQIIYGTVATGDQFLAHGVSKNRIRELGADAVEMEGAAVSYVAHKNEIPTLVIRAISDGLSDESVLDFPKFFDEVAENNIFIIRELLSHIIQTSKVL